MKTINYYKPDINLCINFKEKQKSKDDIIDFVEECRMYKNIDNKISNEIFIKNVLGLKNKYD